MKPFNWDDFIQRIEKALEFSRVQNAKDKFKQKVIPRRKTDYVITQSSAMEPLLSLITLAANNDEPSIVVGEKGTEKDVIARAIHFSGKRSDKPFVEINCGIFSEKEVWFDLIGRPGDEGNLLFQAKEGSIHLEDVHELSILQMEMLQNLLTNYYPNTSNKDIRFIISMFPEKYREDFLRGTVLKIPPLRERREDIPLLAYYFLEDSINEYKKRIEGFTDEAIKELIEYNWSENVKELKQKIRDACLLTRDHLISRENLLINAHINHVNPVSFKEAKKMFEKDYVISLMRMCSGNVSRAAEIAHKDRKDFYYLMRKHRINPKDFR